MDYVSDVLALNPKLEATFKRVFMLAEIEGCSPEKILQDTATTFLSTLIKPRYKDYDLYFESGRRIAGITMANVQKGRKAWKDGTHGVKNNVDQLFNTYESDDINTDVINKSCELVKMSIDHVFLEGSEKKKKDFLQYITHNDFLFVMLQLSVKLIGLKLYKDGIDMENKTLEYVTKMIENNKRKFSKMFAEAVSTNDEEQFLVVCQEYSIEIENLLRDYMRREVAAGTPMGVANTQGRESKLVEQVGLENIHIFLGYLVQHLRIRLQQDFGFNYLLPGIENPTLNFKY